MKYFLDTNILLRYIVAEDAKLLKECKDLMDKVKHNSLQVVTSELVMAEINWVLRNNYRFSKDEVTEALEGIANTESIDICGECDVRGSVALFKKYNVKYIDAMIAAIPKVKSGEWVIVSYDEDFKKLPVKWMKPGEVVR